MGLLTVYLDKCTGLQNVEKRGIPDPYCTVTAKNCSKYVQEGGVDVGQVKSKIIKDNLNPMFNQTMQFTIPELDDHYLYISVKDDNGLLFKDAFMGKTEIKLWEVEGLGKSPDPIEVSRILEQVEHGKLHIRLYYVD